MNLKKRYYYSRTKATKTATKRAKQKKINKMENAISFSSYFEIFIRKFPF